MIKKVHVHDNGLVEFVLLNPLPAGKTMKVDPSRLTLILKEIEQTLLDLEIKTNAAPALSFRPGALQDEYELYMLTAAIPGTVQMRNAKKHWASRRRKA